MENAVRRQGELSVCQTHLSETCQYYALFMGIARLVDCEFADRIKNSFGALGVKQGVLGASNVFIGYYLRLSWLCEIGAYDKVVEECLAIFQPMAEETGTLWENLDTSASCNHGFASAACVFLLRSLTGYCGVKNGVACFEEGFKGAQKNYGVTVRFEYENGNVIVKKA